MQKIRGGVRKYHDEVFPGHRGEFADLEKGQSPQVLFLTCSDSRVDPALLTQTKPGELFVVRNAGNFVPTNQEGDGVIATIEYAIKVLGLHHIVVCGHSHCGAVSAALNPEVVAELPALKAWIGQSGPDFRDFDDQSPDRLLAAVRQNVRVQLAALRNVPCVAEALEEGQVELHGWVYRFELGDVEELDPRTDRFASLNEPSSAAGNPVV